MHAWCPRECSHLTSQFLMLKLNKIVQKKGIVTKYMKKYDIHFYIEEFKEYNTDLKFVSNSI